MCQAYRPYPLKKKVVNQVCGQKGRQTVTWFRWKEKNPFISDTAFVTNEI
jgi:hypothetical protein